MSKTEWKEYKLGEITDSCLGKMLDAKKNRGTPQPYLANVNVRWGSFDLDDLPLMRFEESESERYGLKFGDIVVCEGGEPGRCAIWKDQVPNMKIQKALHRVRCHENVDYRFLYYYLLWAGKKGLFDQYCTGSTIKHLPGEKLKILPIRMPPLAEQQRIAKILSSLDDKIELNNAINRNLEEQAKAIFNSVYDKAVNQVPFTSIISIASGGTPKTSESSFWNGNIPFFTPKDVGIPFTLNTEKYITDEGLNNCNSRLYPTNTTFITARGTVGKLSLAAKPMAMNQSCFALVSERINPILIYMYAIRAVDSLKKKSNGAVFDAITIKDFETERVNKLSDEEIKSLSSIIEPIYNQIRLNTIENHSLSDLRNSLLPKLMSGDLGV